MQIIYIVDALAGAGKTYSAIDFALWAAGQGRKIAIAQPSKELIRQSYNDAVRRNAKGVRIRRIDSEAFCFKTKSTIVQHLKDSEGGVGEILFISHAALLGLPYWHRRDRWELIIDEIPQVVDDLSRTIPDSHARITDALALETFNAAYSSVKIGDASAIEVYADNHGHDEVYLVFQTISQHLLDLSRAVYAHTANWHRVRANQADGKAHKLCLYSVLNPTAFLGFASVTIMGAMFKQSLLYLLWSENPSVEFRPHQKITKRLRYSQHARGDLITVEYLMDHAWSKNLRDQQLSDGRTVLDHVVAEAQRCMAGREFIYVVNKDVENPLTEKFTRGQRVSSCCHGLNAYQTIDNMVFLSALNPAPSEFTFLESMGVSGDELRRANYLTSLYQAVMRISIRDPANSRPKTIVVTDKDAADHLAGLFAGCTVVKNSNMPDLPGKSAGRPKIWKDDAARHRARREKIRHLKDLAELQTEPLAYGISIVPSIYARDVLHHEVQANELLIRELRDALETEVAVKEQNILISSAQFNPSKSKDTRRGLANIECIFGVWLDNDGGGMDHKEFRSIFPTLRMACFPTFTGGDRYRVFIPTTQPMSMDVDEKIKRMLMAELRKSGFCNKVVGEGQRPHGFDMSKITPSSLFYIPCRQPGQDTWFADYQGEELDPTKWIENPTLANTFDQPEPISLQTSRLTTREGSEPAISQLAAIRSKLHQELNTTVDEQADEAKRVYRSIQPGTGKRRHGFFVLALKLKRFGFQGSNMEMHLISADYDGSRGMKTIRDLVRDVRATWRAAA